MKETKAYEALLKKYGAWSYCDSLDLTEEEAETFDKVDYIILLAKDKDYSAIRPVVEADDFRIEPR